METDVRVADDDIRVLYSSEVKFWGFDSTIRAQEKKPICLGILLHSLLLKFHQLG